jgi:alpha-beta hydrolase superfamily lysophospholipase
MTTSDRDASAPNTIVLIHGLWMTALSWEHWVKHYSDKGYRVIARSWPGMEGDIDQLRRDPSAVATLGVTEVVDHYESIIRELDRPPIIMGHSFGGLMTQILLDRGLGAAGVAIDSAPVKGILVLPWSSIRVALPALSNPANNHRASSLTADQFHYAFTNTLSDEESERIFERYAVPGPDHMLFQASLANFNPHAATTVNFANDTRAPLLLIAGGRDHIAPASVTKANYKLYSKSKAVTEYKEYPDRSHFTVGQPGWEQVADFALEWSVEHARMQLPVAPLPDTLRPSAEPEMRA